MRRCYGLRHTYGSILIAMGMDLESIAELLGHEDIQMLVRTYGHNVKKEANKEAAALIDKALLKKDEAPVSVENKQLEAVPKETYKLPDSLPDEAKQVIERLILSYLSPENGGVTGGVSKK